MRDTGEIDESRSVGAPPPSAAVRADESVVSSSLYSMVGLIGTSVCTAVLTLYIVRALGPHGYGIFALALSIGGLVVLPADFGLSSSTARFVADHRHNRREVAALLADATRLKLIASGVACAALAALAGPIAHAYHTPGLAGPLRAMAVAVFGQTMMYLFQLAFIADRKVATNATLVITESLVECGASVVLVIVVGGAIGASAGRAIGYLTGALLAMLLSARTFGWPRAFRWRGRETWIRRIASYGAPLLMVDSAYVMFTAIDLLLISAFLNPTAVGLFSSPARLVTLLAYPGTAIADGVANRMSRGRGQEPNVRAFVAGLRTLLVIQSLILAPLIVWARPIVDILLGSQYHGSTTTLRVFAGAAFLDGIAPLLSLSANFLGEARSRVPLMLGAAVLNGIIDAVLIPYIGIVAGAIGTAAALLVMCVGHLRICRWHLTFSLRPLAATAARSLLAAAVMAAVLLALGTDPPIPVVVIGLPLSVAAFGICLVLLGEVGEPELRAGYRRVATATWARP